MEEQQQFQEVQAPLDITTRELSYLDLPSTHGERQLIEQLDPSTILERIEHVLRGEYFDIATGKWKRYKGSKPLMNEKGIREILLDMQHLVNIGSVFGNLSEDQIRKMIIDYGRDLCFKLSLKWKEFGMEKIHIKIIPKIICRMAFIALMRGEEALTLRLIRTMIRSTESVVQQKPVEKEKKFSLNPFKLFR